MHWLWVLIDAAVMPPGVNQNSFECCTACAVRMWPPLIPAAEGCPADVGLRFPGGIPRTVSQLCLHRKPLARHEATAASC